MNKLIVGVSGGPDSICLLDKLVKDNKEVVVAHVNYQMRASAFFDEKLVNDYCIKHNLILERLYPGPKSGVNFQRWAREVRYQFFAQLVNKYSFDGVAVAHQLNDVVETYLLQKERNSLVDYYGLAYETEIARVKVIRPLLNISSKEVLDYCENNGLAYAIDESNKSDKYKRNRIRKKISDLSKEELLKYNEQIKQENKRLEHINEQVENSKGNLSNLTKDIQIRVVYQLLKKHGYYYTTTKHMEEIVDQLLSKNTYALTNGHLIYYQEQLGYQAKKDYPYSYTFKELVYKDFPHFSIIKKGPTKASVEIMADDWPITIRSWQPGDVIKMAYGHKKVSRYFIDEQVPVAYRKAWPVVLNVRNEIILVPGLGANYSHFTNKPNISVVKYLVSGKGEK